MTKKEVELIARLGPKGQIVLRKEIRKALGIKPGEIVRQRLVKKKVFIEPVKETHIKKEVLKLEKMAKRLGKHWPKGLTAAELIRKERE